MRQLRRHQRATWAKGGVQRNKTLRGSGAISRNAALAHQKERENLPNVERTTPKPPDALYERCQLTAEGITEILSLWERHNNGESDYETVANAATRNAVDIAYTEGYEMGYSAAMSESQPPAEPKYDEEPF